MKLLLILLLINLCLTPNTMAYPQDQLEDCIMSAKDSAQNNPVVKELSDQSIETYCNCSLTSMMDKGESPEDAIKKCARESFN